MTISPEDNLIGVGQPNTCACCNLQNNFYEAHPCVLLSSFLCKILLPIDLRRSSPNGYSEYADKSATGIYMHGNDLRILATSDGQWDEGFNKLQFWSPMLRNTFMMHWWLCAPTLLHGQPRHLASTLPHRMACLRGPIHVALHTQK
jgi:hypothetical protein